MNESESESLITKACSSILEALGEDSSREGLLRTPQRYAKALTEITSGYRENLEDILNGALFHGEHSEMVVVKQIEFYSLCEHHILPFFGHAHVAYVPRDTIVGLSKIPRIVHHFAKRLQVQERLTEQITKTLDVHLNPLGVACVIEASHLCMMMRGVKSQEGTMVTSSMTGWFLKNAATRAEFMNIVRGG